MLEGSGQAAKIMEQQTRVLLIDDDATTSEQLATFLAARFEVTACAGLSYARDALQQRRPHVLVLVPTIDAQRHEQLEELRRICPRLPVVVVTTERSPDVLLDVEAFAPALPARLQRGLGHIASVVAEARSASAA